MESDKLNIKELMEKSGFNTFQDPYREMIIRIREMYKKGELNLSQMQGIVGLPKINPLGLSEDEMRKEIFKDTSPSEGAIVKRTPIFNGSAVMEEDVGKVKDIKIKLKPTCPCCGKEVMYEHDHQMTRDIKDGYICDGRVEREFRDNSPFKADKEGYILCDCGQKVYAGTDLKSEYYDLFCPECHKCLRLGNKFINPETKIVLAPGWMADLVKECSKMPDYYIKSITIDREMKNLDYNIIAVITPGKKPVKDCAECYNWNERCVLCMEDHPYGECPGFKDKTDPTKLSKDENYEFWKNIIYTDGKLDEQKVLNELHDYSFLLDSIPEIYMEVTGGKVSKQNTKSEVVIDLFHDYVNEMIEESKENIEFYVLIIDGSFGGVFMEREDAEKIVERCTQEHGGCEYNIHDVTLRPVPSNDKKE